MKFLHVCLKVVIIVLLSILNILYIQPKEEQYILVWDKDGEMILHGKGEQAFININRYNYCIGDSATVQRKIKQITR